MDVNILSDTRCRISGCLPGSCEYGSHKGNDHEQQFKYSLHDHTPFELRIRRQMSTSVKAHATTISSDPNASNNNLPGPPV